MGSSLHDKHGFYDLSKYSKGSFFYAGEIYMNLDSSEDENVISFNLMYMLHPNDKIKLKALENLVVIITDKILRKHCS